MCKLTASAVILRPVKHTEVAEVKGGQKQQPADNKWI